MARAEQRADMVVAHAMEEAEAALARAWAAAATVRAKLVDVAQAEKVAYAAAGAAVESAAEAEAVGAAAQTAPAAEAAAVTSCRWAVLCATRCAQPRAASASVQHIGISMCRSAQWSRLHQQCRSRRHTHGLRRN